MEGTLLRPLAKLHLSLPVQLVDLGLVEGFRFCPRLNFELLFSQIEFTLLPKFFKLYLSQLRLLESSFHSSGFVIGYLFKIKV